MTWHQLAECREWDLITPGDPWWRENLTPEQIDDRLDLCHKPCPVMIECRQAHMRGPADERPIGVAGGLMFTEKRNKAMRVQWTVTPRMVPAAPVLSRKVPMQQLADLTGIDVISLTRSQRSGQLPRSHASRIEWCRRMAEAAA